MKMKTVIERIRKAANGDVLDRAYSAAKKLALGPSDFQKDGEAKMAAKKYFELLQHELYSGYTPDATRAQLESAAKELAEAILVERQKAEMLVRTADKLVAVFKRAVQEHQKKDERDE